MYQKNVPKNFISQLKSMDATVSIVGNSYDESLKIAIDDSKKWMDFNFRFNLEEL